MKIEECPPIPLLKIKSISRKQCHLGKVESKIITSNQFGGNYDYKILKRGKGPKGKKGQQTIDLTIKQEEFQCKISNDIDMFQGNEGNQLLESSEKDSCHDVTEIQIKGQNNEITKIELPSKTRCASDRYPERKRIKPFRYWLGERYKYSKGKIIGMIH